MPKKKTKQQKNKPPAFQLYAKDYLAHAAREFTLEANGAYLILFMFAWDSNPIATLPSNPEQLRRIVGATVEEWNRIWPQIESKFSAYPDDANKLYNERLHKQWIELKTYSEDQAERANRRWNNDSGGSTDEDEEDVPQIHDPGLMPE